VPHIVIRDTLEEALGQQASPQVSSGGSPKKKQKKQKVRTNVFSDKKGSMGTQYLVGSVEVHQSHLQTPKAAQVNQKKKPQD